MNTQVKEREQVVEDRHANSYFTSKEHYLKFRQSWKDYINAGKHRCETGTSNGHKWKGDSELTALHHFIYNSLRRKDFKTFFSPITNEGRLNAGYSNPYRAFYSVKGSLGSCAHNIENPPKWGKQHFEAKLANLKVPFGDTLTNDMIVKLYKDIKNIEL